MDIEIIKRYSLVEVALLAIFFIGLLTAHLIVKVRSQVILSEPIALPGSGLSVSVPDNAGWTHSAAWQYDDLENGMMLVSQFTGSAHSRRVVRWNFVFVSPDISEKELLEQKAEKIDAVIQNFGKTDRECPMVYARMLLSQSSRQEIYWGVMRLGLGRSIELLVSSEGPSGYHGENIFKSLVKSVRYQPGQELAGGRELMDDFMNTLATDSFHPVRPNEAFLIRDALGENRGYYYARHSALESQGRRVYKSQIQQFEHNASKISSELWFDPFEKSCRWKSEFINSRTKRTGVYGIASDEDGTLWFSQGEVKVKSFPSNRSFIPEPLLPEFVHIFLQSAYDRVVVDVLGARGQWVPVRLTKLTLDNADPKTAASVVQIDFLHLSESYEKLLFDDSQNLLEKFEQQSESSVRIWQAVPVEQLRHNFEVDFQTPTDAVVIGP